MARSFNGSTDKITATAVDPNLTHALTLSCWFKTTTVAAGYRATLGYTPNFAMFNGAATTTHNSYYVQTNAGTAGRDPASATVSINTWYHQAMTAVDGAGTCQGYLNGVADGASFTTPNSTFVSAANVSIGHDAGPDLFNGSLADVAIWNVTLTSLEIAALAAGVRPGRIRPSSLIGWWPLDGLVSPEPDLSGRANNGTLTAAPALDFGPPISLFTPRWPQYFKPPVAGAASLVFKNQTLAIPLQTNISITLGVHS
jgi:hypothetical protein